MRKGIYAENGVFLSKASLRVGDEVELIYNGLLKACGATEIKAHIGYNEMWEDAATMDMDLINDSFVTKIAVKNSGSLNCAFVDPLGNWDNNSGNNYTFKVIMPRKAKANDSGKTSKKAAGTAQAQKGKKTTRAKKNSKNDIAV